MGVLGVVSRGKILGGRGGMYDFTGLLVDVDVDGGVGGYVLDLFAGGEGFFELLEGTVGIAVAADEESSAGSFRMC